MDIQMAEKALRLLCDTIESTGGVKSIDKVIVPVGDEDWSDLADAYIAACDALERAPLLAGTFFGDEP